MSDQETRQTQEGGLGDLGLATEPAPSPRRRRRRGAVGCLSVLVVLALLAGGAYVALTKGVDYVQDYFADPADFAGPGSGSVLIEVQEGDTATDIAATLEEEGVVASTEAFVAAANARPEESAGIQVGFYELQSKMAASDALDVLVDPENLLQNAVTIPEGLQVTQILDLLAKNTDFSRARFEKALDKPDKIGLPSYADGKAEGYLFPATYNFRPDATPVSMLRQMVDRWRQAAEEADLEAAAERLGYTPHELMTVASLVEAEGRGDDMPKVARVIYNRLEGPGDKQGTNGLLQIDAAVNYALGQSGIARLTEEEIQSVADSPYNTYTQPGLPPGPIEAPGAAAIDAAANPADGDWYYYVTVNLATGETKFAETYDEFLQFKAELDEYCATQSDRC